MKKTIMALFLLVGMIFMTGCSKNLLPWNWGSNDKSDQQVEKQQGNEQIKAPENMESDVETGTSIAENSTDKVKYYSASNNASVSVNGVYPNGDKGFNFIVKEGDLTNGVDPDREFGITTDGIYYTFKDPVDKHNPDKRNPKTFALGGPFQVDDRGNWGYTEAGVVVVKDKDNKDKAYYTLKSPKGPVAEKAGYYKFCGWYMDTNKFWPHEGEKSHYFTKVDQIVR